MRMKIDKGWRFYFGGESPFSGAGNPGVAVNLPHDFSIIQKRDPNARSGAAGGFFPGGLGCYKKTIFVPEDWKEKAVALEFEGVYMNAEIHFNNQLVARHIYGYTSFFCDITPYLRYGKDNELSVNVNNNALPNSRWYSGSGIYRHVWLEVRDRVHIAPWGVFAKTPKVSAEDSLVLVETLVENQDTSRKEVTIRSQLIDMEGNKAACKESDIELPANGKMRIKQKMRVSPAHLWSVDDPYLYTLKSEVICGGKVIDARTNKIGIRSISFDPKNGFRLNGVPLKLKGGCVHHDCGVLGAASYDRAEERKVELHKRNGFNAVRCAHNPPSPAFLDACDRLGILVIDEAFDCWRESKNPNDFGVYFDMLWKKEIESMILRDRNHPCIIMWSTGNEIIERDGRSGGYELAAELANFVRSLDDTRAMTNALCPIPGVNDKVDEKSLAKFGDGWGDATEKFAEPLDVVGYNYLCHRYEYDGKKYPKRVICATESYPSQAFEYWRQVESNPHVIGDFVWSSIDYLGEAGIGRVWYGENKSFLGGYPWHMANCGDFDICGDKRPQSYYRDCVWGISKAPYIAVYNPKYFWQQEGRTPWSWPNVVPSWNWPGFEGKPIMLEVYCADSEVEVFVNGKSIGRKKAGKAQKYKAVFETVYEPGEIVAVGYEDGRENSRTALKTAGKPHSIRLSADRMTLDRGDEDLAYVFSEIVDDEGNLVFNADNEIYFTVSGGGSLLAVGNGDPLSEEMYTGNKRKAYHGKALAVVRSNGVPGKAVLAATADGLPEAKITIEIK